MSPFRTWADRSMFLAPPAPPIVAVEAALSESAEAPAPSRPVAHWWQRLGRKRIVAAMASDPASTAADAMRST